MNRSFLPIRFGTGDALLQGKFFVDGNGGKRKMKKANGKVPILDIHLSSFLSLYGIEPEFTKQGTRVVFEFPASQEVNKLTRTYNENPSVPVLDFVHHLRKLRSQMLASR